MKTTSKSRIQEAAALGFKVGGQTFQTLLLQSDAVWVVLTDDSRVVGAAGASKTNKMLTLTIAYIAPEARGLGIQQKLIKLRLRWGKKQGCTIAYTYTYRRNHVSMVSLIKEKFSPYHVDKRDFVYFARFL